MTFLNTHMEVVVLGFVPIDISVSLGGSLELDIGFLGCQDDLAEPHGIVLLQVHPQVYGSGSIGIGTQWIAKVGAEVHVEFLGGVIHGGADWNLKTVGISNPWPTCIGGNFSLNGFDTRIYFYSKGLIWNTKKIVAEFPAKVLTSTIALACNDGHQKPPPTPSPVNVPWDPKSSKAFAGCPPRTSTAVRKEF